MTKLTDIQMNRRSFAIAASVALGSAAVAKTGFARQATPSTGEWTFTDDKGVLVTLPQCPERLVIDVNAAAPLWDMGITPTALFGWNVYADGTLGAAGGSIDPTGIQIVGDINEPINIEKLVAQSLDLVITIGFDLENPTDYWSIEEKLVPQVEAVVPIIAISATGKVGDNMLRFAELAAALGADLETEAQAQAEADYDAALANFQSVLGDKSDLTCLFIAPDAETVWVAYPPDWTDLSWYVELGLNAVVPDAEPGSWWEGISHEQALKYPADVVFLATRPSVLPLEEMQASPRWSKHPAFKANQVFGWNMDVIASHEGLASALHTIADGLAASEKVI